MKEHLGWQFWTAVIIGLIGASAWLPQIKEWSLKPKMEGKIISQYHNYGSLLNDTIQGSLVVQKISLFSKNKDFFNKTLKVFLKFPDKEKEVEAQIITTRELIFTFKENGENVRKILNINANEHLLHMSVFLKNSSIVGYLVLKINFKININYEYIRYEFISFSGKKLELLIPSREIKENELIHDVNIWK